MSDIERFVTIWGGGGMMPANNGNYVRYDDHRAEVERVMADVVKLRIDLNSAQVAANQRRGEVERLKNAIDHLTSERDAAQAEVERLKEQVGALTLAVEQADEMKANAEAAVLVEEAETDRVLAERNAAQVEVYRLENAIDNLTSERDEAQDERDAAQAEVERLRANGQAILDSSRPDDETIWREAFMSQLHDRYWAASEVADFALAEYRKRWPR